MSPRFSLRSTRTSALRTRAAVLTAGFAASVALGASGAVAAELQSTPGTTAVTPAQAVVAKKAPAREEASKRKKSPVGKAPAKKALSWVKPVRKYTKSARFAQAGGMWHATHSGQDFAVPSGTRVVAAHSGTVVKAGGNGAGDGPAYGNAIVIRHGKGTFTQYAHLSRIDVRVGQVVKAGQCIAKSGNTGNSSGPHLHFEVRRTAHYGSAVDPVAYLRAKGLKI